MCLWRDFTFRQPGPAPSRHGKAPVLASGDEPELADHAVTVRCLVAGNGPVPDADDAPGNVAVVARAD